jgi:hypothetical protein
MLRWFQCLDPANRRTHATCENEIRSGHRRMEYSVVRLGQRAAGALHRSEKSKTVSDLYSVLRTEYSISILRTDYYCGKGISDQVVRSTEEELRHNELVVIQAASHDHASHAAMRHHHAHNNLRTEYSVQAALLAKV